jgi:transposase
LDEVAPPKGQGRYRLSISAPEDGYVLDVLPDRNKETLEAWFAARGAAWCEAGEVWCADMCDAYHEAAQANLPNARAVVDRFHVMQNLNAALTKARRTIQKQADAQTQAQLKGCRWLLFKTRENVADAEQLQLDARLAASPLLNQCYALKEACRAWFNAPHDRVTAATHLDVWRGRVEASGLKAVQAFTKTLNNWRERILNYFDGRHSNGFAEGVNLKINLISRRAFGYRNFDSFRLHVLVAFEPILHQSR